MFEFDTPWHDNGIGSKKIVEIISELIISHI